MPEFPAWLMYPGLGNDPPSAQMFGGFQVWTASPVVGSYVAAEARWVAIDGEWQVFDRRRHRDLRFYDKTMTGFLLPSEPAEAPPGGRAKWKKTMKVGYGLSLYRQVSIEEATKKKREHDLAMGRRSNSAAFWPEGMAPAEPPAPIPEPPADRLEVGADLWSNASVDPDEDNGWRP